MAVASQDTSARADAHETGEDVRLELSGVWTIMAPRPVWREAMGARMPRRVRIDLDRVDDWDSALLLFVLEGRRWCEAQGVQFDESTLPANVRELLGQLASVTINKPATSRPPGLVTAVGLDTTRRVHGTRDAMHFLGEFTLSAIDVLKNPARLRWKDALVEIQLCGVMALPIVGLINFLVGVTLAYTGAIVLRQYGGDIYVADLVGLSMVREMGPMMTAIVIAGRTGAAFAAQIANMKAGEEVDALETFGLRPIEFLVLPRVLALALMMPLLALYGNALGIFGGMVIAKSVLDISPTAYWIEMLTIVDLSDNATGIIKAATFGLIVGFSGCMRGLQADRSAAGVGQAATSAVVTSILLIIVADAIYAVIFNILRW